MGRCQAGSAEGESERSALSCEPAEQGSHFAEPLLFIPISSIYFILFHVFKQYGISICY